VKLASLLNRRQFHKAKKLFIKQKRDAACIGGRIIATIIRDSAAAGEIQT
jgi:hypothetical protein